MKLTGKCKEDFEKWYSNNIDTSSIWYGQEPRFHNFPPSMQWGVYQDFFDSKGIFPEVQYNEVGKKFSYNIWFNPVRDDIMSMSIYNTRQEARAKAIELANEKYNKL